MALMLIFSGAPAAQARFIFTAPPKAYTEARGHHEKGEYTLVIAKLTPDVLQELRRRELKRAYLYLGTAYQTAGRLDKALGEFQLGVSLFPRNTELLTKLARLYHHAEMEQQALPLFNKVIKLDPSNTEAHLGLAEIDRTLGFLHRSADHYEIVLEVRKNAPHLWRDYAEVLLEQHDNKTAEFAALKSLELAPNDEQAKLLLAFIYRAKGDGDAALLIVSGLGLAKSGPEPMRLLEALWLLEAGRLDDARKISAAVLAQWPSQPLARWTRARVLLKAGKKALALKDLKVASASKEAPFVAEIAAAMIKELSLAP